MATRKPSASSKSALIKQLLSRTKGAALEEMCQTTNWQPHSVRAFLTGLRKKGYMLVREQHGGTGTIYRITEHPDDLPPPSNGGITP
jgi:predicted ArsR family transcriptional regulator